MMLSLFMWLYWKGIKDHSKRYQLLALLAAVYATYLKEPVFVVWVVFALSNLIFGKLSHDARCLNYSLLVNSVVWLAVYWVTLNSADQSTMYRGASFIPQKLMLRSFDHDPFMYILLVLEIARGYFVVFKKDDFCIFTDAPLFAGVAYTLMYVLINVHGYYLVVPSLILELPALGKFLMYSGSKFKKCVAMLIFLCLPVSLFNSIQTVIDIHNHRVNDKGVFHEIMKARKFGAHIVYISKFGNHDGDLTFRRYKAFLDYYSKSDFPLFRGYSCDAIGKNSVVILCTSGGFDAADRFIKIREEIGNRGLKLFHSNDEILTEIYENVRS